MESKIKVSVIMPVYNSGEYLQTAVDSILSQSLKDIELILVDDGSTDGSSEKCDEYANQDKRVVVIHQKNGGICNARNAALKIAKGEYIGFSDHDDEFLPGLLEKSYAKALETDADVVKFSKKVYVTLDGVLVKDRSNHLPDSIWTQREIKENYFRLFDDLKIDCVWDSLFRKKILVDNNIFFDEFYKCGGEDYDLTARYLPYIKKLVMMSDTFYIHYVRKGYSTSSKFNFYKYKHLRFLTNRIYEGANILGVDLIKEKDVSNFFITEFYINSIVALLCNSECNFSYSQKIRMVKDLWDEKFMTPNFYKSSVLRMIKKSPKIGVAYFFCKYKFYSLLFVMHSLRNWQLNSKIFNKILNIKSYGF